MIDAATTTEPSAPPVSAGVIVWHHLVRSRRALLGLVLLGLLALAGIFAEVIASPAPLFASGPRGTSVFPGVFHAEVYAGLDRAAVDRLHAADSAIWPVVRYGPDTLGEAAPEAGERREPAEDGGIGGKRPRSFPNAPAGAGHPLGTDAEGRDLAARLVYGARTALGLSLAAVLVGMILGVGLGGLAGYKRGFWDDRLVRLVETVGTFPAIIVVALVRAIERHPSALSLVIAVGFVRWAEIARVVRIEVVRATAEDYVVAARALGAPPFRVFARHILPAAIGPAIVSSVFGVASVVLLEAAISFLGMGVASHVPSWGETLAEGARDPAHLRLLLLPGVLLAATVGGSYLLAAALRDAMDPRMIRVRES